MMSFSYMVVIAKMRLAYIVKQCYDSHGIFRKRKMQFFHLFVDAKGMDCQSSGELVMRATSCTKIGTFV